MVDADEALAFLRAAQPGGAWVLDTAKGGRARRHRRATDEAEVRAFVEATAGRDVYVLLGIAADDVTGQPEKPQMRGSRLLWVDLDPRAGEDLAAEREHMQARLGARRPVSVPPPSLVVDSGRGFWAFWLLAEPCMDTALVERHNQTLGVLFGALGDACHNCNRIGRLPGTVNEKNGNVARVCWGLSKPDAVYSLADMPPPGAACEAPTFRLAVGEAQSVEDLPAFLAQYGLPDRIGVIVNHGRVPGETKAKDDSRSAWLHEATCGMARVKVPPETMLGILLDRAFGISNSVYCTADGRAVPNPEKYARRQVERAYEAVEAPPDLERDDKGVPHRTQGNIRIVLRLLGARLSHDTFANRLLVGGVKGIGPVLDDAALRRLFLLADERHGLRPTKDLFWMVAEDEACLASFHPILNYLGGLRWDGRPRLDGWLSTYGGAEANDYTRAVGSLLLVAAVRRIRQPGCKFDEMVVLEGDQGTNKSSALRLLAVEDDWFSDDLPLNAESKVVVERLAGRWIVEAAELKGMRQGAVESMKAFLSRAVDRACSC
ncbi:VapE domain-containing protein [Falsiroseomonas sp.]|uniref:VapE domain-containing protein n=1 Tax=Falsiroseomonas sp. TaxID=2870721 RepID=UPI0035641BB7